MNFIDQCTIEVSSGSGGPGCVAFHRAANHPRGGPAGGDGGDGGSVILLTDPQLSTLHDLAYRKTYKARNGEPGQGRDCYGKHGSDVVVAVPVGTLVKDPSGVLLCDLNQPGQQFVAARGGKGGWGNIHFATSTNQAPHRADPGEPGQERMLMLELRLLADVGLLGYPNVGKSTLVSRISAARPKIANYPFTTLAPNLGVARLPLDHPKPTRSLVVADIPGLIEGAHEGKGLGHQFLRHVERTRVLIHLLEISLEPGRDPWHDFVVLNNELRKHNEQLAKRPQLVALSKMDLSETKEQFSTWQAHFAKHGILLHGISAATGEGVGRLLEAAYQQAHKPVTPNDSHTPT